MTVLPQKWLIMLLWHVHTFAGHAVYFAVIFWDNFIGRVPLVQWLWMIKASYGSTMQPSTTIHYHTIHAVYGSVCKGLNTKTMIYPEKRNEKEDGKLLYWLYKRPLAMKMLRESRQDGANCWFPICVYFLSFEQTLIFLVIFESPTLGLWLGNILFLTMKIWTTWISFGAVGDQTLVLVAA